MGRIWLVTPTQSSSKHFRGSQYHYPLSRDGETKPQSVGMGRETDTARAKFHPFLHLCECRTALFTLLGSDPRKAEHLLSPYIKGTAAQSFCTRPLGPTCSEQGNPLNPVGLLKSPSARSCTGYSKETAVPTWSAGRRLCWLGMTFIETVPLVSFYWKVKEKKSWRMWLPRHQPKDPRVPKTFSCTRHWLLETSQRLRCF